MDSFAQAAAYLQPSLEFVAKLSSIIPLWMIMVMADKHFLGLPLLEGSVWHSPRIPPRFRINSGRGGHDASSSKFGRHSTSFGPSPLERGFPDSTTPYPRPFRALHFFSDTQPLGASSTTALTLYQPLEVHDPFISSSGWLEPGYVGSAVLLVLVMAFFGIITNGRWSPFSKSQATQARKTSDTGIPFSNPMAHQVLAENMGFPICWAPSIEDLVSNYSDESLEDSLDQPSTPTRTNEDEDFSPLKMIADTAEKAKKELVLKDGKAEKAEGLVKEKEKSDQTETVTKMEKEQENPEGEIPETEIQNDGQEEKTETNEADATTEEKPESCAKAGNDNGSKAGEGDGKEDWKEGSKVDIKEERPSESGHNAGNEESDGSPAMGEGIKKKKRRVRQNAKKRAAKLAAAEEAKKEAGDSSNAFPQDLKQREDKDGKSKAVEPGVVEPEASDVLATAKGQEEDKATTKDTPTTGKGGGYSFKETDLHDATFVAADTAQKTSLPPRPPTPQSTKKPVPVGLPSKPRFSGLPTPKSNGTPQSSPAATANPTPSPNVLSPPPKGPTRPKGSVPPLMPHHQSFGAGQSSSNGPSGQFPTPFQNIPGLSVPTTAPTPNHIPYKPGAVNPSPDGPKPLFGGLTAQGGPTAGTDPRPKKPYLFGNGHPSAPMFGNLPPGPCSHDAFKLPVFGPSADFGQSGAGPAKTAPINQSIPHNLPTSSGLFTGFGSSSAGPAKFAPTNQPIFQNMPTSSGQFTGFGSPSAGPAKSAPTSQSIFQNVSIPSGPFTGFVSSSASPARTAPTNQSIFHNMPTSSGPFTGFGSSSAGSAKTAPTNQSVFQNMPISSGPFTGFGSPSAGTTSPPLAHTGSMFQKIAPPPTPLSLGINQQCGVMPLQNAVMGAMNPAAGNKMEGTKPAAGPGALPFKPRPMPKGRLGLSRPERPWPCARQGDGASYWRTGESVSWPHARQMNGKSFWR